MKLLFLIFFVSVLNAETYKAVRDTAQYLKNPNYLKRIEEIKKSDTKQANIVMLGNSITYGADWKVLLGRKDVVGQGIVSDILEGFANRLEYVYRLNPKIVYILGGINDIYSWIPNDVILKHYSFIISELKSRNIKPVIQSVIYAGKKWNNSEERNPIVKNFNRSLRMFAIKNDVEFIDLNIILSKNGFLKPEFTNDNLHLNEKGYKEWANLIKKSLQKNEL